MSTASLRFLIERTTCENVAESAASELDAILARLAAAEKRADDVQRAAIVGASVAMMTSARINSGNGSPDIETMRSFLEEANDIADLAAEAQS